jgi:hypothetical protein
MLKDVKVIAEYVGVGQMVGDYGNNHDEFKVIVEFNGNKKVFNYFMGFGLKRNFEPLHFLDCILTDYSITLEYMDLEDFCENMGFKNDMEMGEIVFNGMQENKKDIELLFNYDDNLICNMHDQIRDIINNVILQ